ncbi:MAG: metallophosphoesterase [Candidatus Nanopusillus sp.]
MLKFTRTEGLIFFNKILVISDLHIGIEKELYKKGINIPSQVNYYINKIRKIYEKHNLKYLIIDGDLKHNVPETSLQEIFDIPYFINEISQYFKKIYIIKGNHDGDIEDLITGINNVKILKALKIKNVVFTHGHLNTKLKGKYYVIGHHHFAKIISTSIGESIYEKVFIIGYKGNKVIIILPAFSDLAGLWDVGEFQGPIAKGIEKYEVYTLDGILIEEKEIKN